MSGYEPIAIEVGDRFCFAYRRWFMSGHVQIGQTRFISNFACKTKEQAIKLATRHIRNKLNKPVFFRNRETALLSVSRKHQLLIESRQMSFPA